MTTPSRVPFDNAFVDIQAATRRHRAQHGCGAYTFEDGPALIRLASQRLPSRVLELGTALGYTACCLAHGSPQALVDTIEGDREHVKLAQAQIACYELSSRITVHHGQFDAVLSTLLSGYDLAFFDGFAPPLDVILRIRQLLSDDGVLVCSNLQLASGKEAERLDAELANSERWQRLDPIEGGRTAVLAKRLPAG